MKEFVEKLIEQLEKLQEKYKGIRENTHCIVTETSECDSCKADSYLYARLKCVDEVKEIVNQLAEEHNNDFCEWEYDDFEYGWQTSCGTTFSLCDSDKEITHYCPYCGKKIKVVE